MRSSLSQEDSASVISARLIACQNIRSTEHNDVDPRLVEFFCYGIAAFSGPVVCVVNDYLATRVEEIPDELFTALHDLVAKRDRLRALLSLLQGRLNKIGHIS